MDGRCLRRTGDRSLTPFPSSKAVLQLRAERSAADGRKAGPDPRRGDGAMIEAAGLYRLLSHAFTKDRYDPSAHGTLIGLAKTAAERSHDLRKALYDITPALVRALCTGTNLCYH